MPRKYVRKTKPNYSSNDIPDALSDIKSDKLSVVDAAQQYNIPLTTLYSRISGYRGSNNRAHPPLLSIGEEQFWIHMIELFQDWQQPLTRKSLIDMA